ncbi:hypothetical protein GGR56DRAFT_657305 [Xylariaceae sp. FL0804]|nr:hypothetical protein GGR56DRAFT_657305 [Xylariaceae sp. FL0804]
MPSQPSPYPADRPPSLPSLSDLHVDQDRLPSGQCRYILLNPEVKGQRCACVGFMLNHALPGVACQCGHLSCYHIKSTQPPPEKTEMDGLRRRIEFLEGQLDRENHSGIGSTLGSTLRRLSELEEQIETSRDDAAQEMRDCYRNVNRVWQSVDQLERRQAAMANRSVAHEERLDTHDHLLQSLRDRLVDIDDASMALEERVEALEDADTAEEAPSEPRRSGSLPEPVLSGRPRRLATRRRHPSRQRDAELPRALAMPPRDFQPMPVGSSEAGTMLGPWTVHVSLMPAASQPFPFEKDTNAYKRCLSRGLHQMVAVDGNDSGSFVRAVSKVFGGLLRGRDWMPLQARLCDAASLQGLPMLRPLEPDLIGADYDLDFLRTHCAVCFPNGRIESLYIAMLSDTLSWTFLRRSPCWMEGLEASWEYDAWLDRNDEVGNEEDQPSAGEIIPPLPSLKRTASEMTRAAPFNTSPTAEAAESPRPKLQRTTCMQPAMEPRRRGVETA